MHNLWTKIATSVVNLPASHPAKKSILAGLDNAQRQATYLATPFSDEWYVRAVEAILLNGEETKRFFFFRLAEEYTIAHAELGLAMAERDGVSAHKG